jgi:dihydrofolate reductase
MSLDGFIAGPNGEADWIVMDPDIDFAGLFAQFDTFLMGRKTFEMMASQGQGGGSPGTKTFVFSKTLRQKDHPGVTIVSEAPEKVIAQLKSEPGKDIWLFGGGSLFTSLASKGLVDTVEVAVIPVMLGGGLPAYPPPSPQLTLEFTGHKVYPKSGIVLMEYDVKRGKPPKKAARKRSK